MHIPCIFNVYHIHYVYIMEVVQMLDRWVLILELIRNSHQYDNCGMDLL